MPNAHAATVAGLEITGTKTLPPTPDILDALEKDYPLEASVADLVDNSIDAGARQILIRFMMSRGNLVSLCVVDDGHGMRGVEIDRAMRFGAKRRYGAHDLGMFGVGLKTASLSQADKLTVISRRRGSGPVGRQWTKSGIKKADWQLNILSARSAKEILSRQWGSISAARCGTVVRWDDVYDFDRLRYGIDAYLERVKVKMQLHLGLRLHRFLERRRLHIHIDAQDVDTTSVGPPSAVSPLNPFPARGRSGATGYPKQLLVRLPGRAPLAMIAHIWRKRSGDDGYKLGGGRVAEHQGFYFYRHDRLIQDGGWSDIIGTNEPHMSLARVEIDIPDHLGSYLKVRSNKNGVDVPASFADAVEKAKAADGTSFRDYLGIARDTYRKRAPQRIKPMLAPGEGVPAEVRKALLRRSVPLVRGAGCTVSWGHTPNGALVDVDQETRSIILNKRYRRLLLRGAHGGKTDLPLLRTLLYFVFQDVLAGDRIGRVDRMLVDTVVSAMNAALTAEKRWVRE